MKRNPKIHFITLEQFKNSNIFYAALTDCAGPDFTSLEFPYQCNSNCSFCLEDKTFSGDNVRELLRDNTISSKNIAICTGEPTLYKGLFALIKKLKKVAGKVSIATNGRRLKYKYYTKQLLDVGVDEFLVSLHGPKKIHDKLTRTPGSFEETVSGIKVLKSLGSIDKVRIIFVINRENIDFMKDVIILTNRLGVKRLDFITLVPLNNGKLNYSGLMPSYTAIYSMFKVCFNFLEKSRDHKQLKILLSGVPPCLIRNDNLPYIFHNSKEFENLKIKGLFCNKCFLNNRCNGVWKDYIELYGWKEFN